MKRKLVFVFLAIVLSTALFAGGGGQGQTPQRSGAEIVTAPGTFPVVSTPITLRVFAGGSPNIENFETNDFTRFYEEKTGVRLQWTISPPGSGPELRRLSIASGDLPDFYMGAGFTKMDEVQYGRDGVFIPLNDLIDQYGFWIKEMFNNAPQVRPMITTPDGNIYSLPLYHDSLHNQYTTKLYINTGWMRNLNLQTPNTLDEYTNVLRAFRTRDPNGNGLMDEIPHITSQPGGIGINALIPFFVNSFIEMDPGGFLVTGNDRVEIAYDKPEFRQALTYLNSLVNEGLLDPTSFTVSEAELRQIAENPQALTIGSTVMLAPSSIFSMTSPRQREFDAIAPLAGPGGVRAAVYHSNVNVQTGQTIITSRCQYPEAVVRWNDWFFTQEGLMTMRIGREGIEWNWARPGELGISGIQGIWHNIGAQGGSTNAFWMQYGVAQYNQHSAQVGVSENLFYGPEGLNTRIYRYTAESYVPFRPAKYLPAMYFEADVLEPIVQSINDIDNYKSMMWARFVTGDLPLTDQNWNNYINALNSMGIRNVLNAYQRTYDTFLRNASR